MGQSLSGAPQATGRGHSSVGAVGVGAASDNDSDDGSADSDNGYDNEPLKQSWFSLMVSF